MFGGKCPGGKCLHTQADSLAGPIAALRDHKLLCTTRQRDIMSLVTANHRIKYTSSLHRHDVCRAVFILRGIAELYHKKNIFREKHIGDAT